MAESNESQSFNEPPTPQDNSNTSAQTVPATMPVQQIPVNTPADQAPGQTYTPQGQIPVVPPRSPYEAQGQQMPYQPPHQVYPPQNPYHQPPVYQQQPAKARVWPWVLGICLLVGLLGIGGCVSCIAFSAAMSDQTYNRGYDYDYNYDDSYPYNHDDGYSYDSGESGSSASELTYTLAEIESLVEGLPNIAKDNVCSTGAFEVGPTGDIKAGLYYLEGSQDEEGRFMIFEKDASGGENCLLVSEVYYFGNYFADLKEGQIIVFLAPSSKSFYPTQSTAYETTDPIQSGCYRVGIDIPAGTYTVKLHNEGLDTMMAQDAGVYIMKDLSWKESSIVDYYYLIEGSAPTITLVEGQYVELYKATMVAATATA